MSTLKVNKIENTATTDGGIEIDNTGHVQIDGVQLPTAGTLSNRNLIINGAMQVAQRSSGAQNDGYGQVDRYRTRTNDGGYSLSQSTDVPTGQGFGFSNLIDVTSTAGQSGSFFAQLQTRIEGQDLQSIKKGTSNAEQVTLSFWIKSTKTGTYILELEDTDNSRSISQAYTVNDSDTWEYKTLTFAADTTGAFTNDNGHSLTVIWWLYAGSTYTSGTLATSWATLSNPNRAVGQVNAADNTSNNIYITGVQLELGEQATPFEHRSYGDEISKCHRYYWKTSAITNSNLPQTADGRTRIITAFPTEMREAPTVVATDWNLFSNTTFMTGYYSAANTVTTLPEITASAEL